MERDKDRSFSKKLFSYLPLLEQVDPLDSVHIDYPLPYDRRLPPEEQEEQKRQYRRFLLLQTLGS